MAIVSVKRGFLRQIEVITVLHQKLAAPHHTETRADLVAKLPLDVVKGQRQVLVTIDIAAEDLGDEFFVRRTIKHVAPMTVGDPQHLFAVVIITPAFAPQVRTLQGGHQQWDVACQRLFLVHDLLDIAQHAIAKGQPGINPRTCLPDHARAQHQPVRHDLRLSGRFLQDGQEISGQSHGSMDLSLDGTQSAYANRFEGASACP